jgi:hypothetical protein
MIRAAPHLQRRAAPHLQRRIREDRFVESAGLSVAELDRALGQYGRMNYYQPCTVDGHHGRVTMNGERVFLAVHIDRVEVVSEPFAAVRSSGAGRVRRVRFAERAFDIDFHDEGNASRFSRVLETRHDPHALSGRTPLHSKQRTAPAGLGAALAYPGSPQQKARQYADRVMVFSAALIVLGFLDLVVGVILGLALLARGGGWFALAWLLFAALGSAMPFCLACLARMIVYRDRAAASV